MEEQDHGEWWRDAVVYQIYPRSFADSDGTGTGDLRGIRQRLQHLVDLGVDAIWLSPIQPSPMADFGYDISGYCDVDPLFGDLDEFDALVADCHAHGLRVVLDFVPNHTSDMHPWFLSARSGRDSPDRSRYVWRDPAPDGGPPNNWKCSFSEDPAWTFDEASGQYYLHLFLPQQPDLDWNEPAVQRDMAGVLRFWMDRDVDGFRADVVHCIGKAPELPDAPDELAGLPACIFDHGPGTHERLRELRRVVDGDRPGEHLLLGETYVFDREQQLSYLGDGDELHLAFNFMVVHAPWDARAWREELEAAYAGHDRAGAWPTWVLSNHDVRRHRTRYGSEARARAAAVALLTLRGTPFIYQGDELGLEDAVIPADRAVDPGGRDGCRAPLPWTSDVHGGWGPDAWLPGPPDPAGHSVEAQSGDPRSMLDHYRRLLALRHDLDVLRSGSLEMLDSPEGVLRWRRSIVAPPRIAAVGRAGHGTPEIVAVEVAVNFTDRPVADAVSTGRVLGGTLLPGRADPSSSTLAPDEARIVDVG